MLAVNQFEKKNVTSKIDLLMGSLTKFFSNTKNMDTMLPVVQGCSKISLRILDWFVTNYCKKNNTVITQKKNGISSKMIVHLDYKNQLKAYSKKQFDPFCRRERINFGYVEDQILLTTVGQLNFFRWAIEYGIINYIYDNLEFIEKDMNASIRNLYKLDERGSDGKKKKKKKTRIVYFCNKKC